MNALGVIMLLVGLLALGGSAFVFFRSQNKFKAEEKENERKMYELAILKEIGERTGYSLNVQNIVDIITGSLHQFMEYCAVSYMLIKPEKIIFKVHLEKSVSRRFINDIQDRMLKSISALLDKEFKKEQVEELLSGAILVDEMDQPVKSYFNIPLVIAEEAVGILTVADTREGLYGEEETTILYKLVRQASQAVSRLQEVIENEQRKLNAMVESMNEGVVMTDKDYRILVANPAVKKAIGLPEKNDITIFDFIDNLDGKFDIRGKLEESVKLDKILTSDEVLIGDKFYQIFVSPVKSDASLNKDEVLGGVVIFHDITREKEIEKMKEDFTSMMVHELRSPLNGIHMIAQVMAKAKKVSDVKKYSQNVGLVKSSTESMLSIVNDLLDAAKLESGKFEIHLEPANPKKIIEDRVNFYEAQAQSGKLTIQTEFGDDLPEQVILDQARITQVLNNLISNSLKFTDEGGQIKLQSFIHKKGEDLLAEAKQKSINWMFRPEDGIKDMGSDAIVLAVTDSGRGISRDNLKNLFNKFVQFQSTAESADKKGTGLGLVITKGIVEAHKGRIEVASEEGVGTTFACIIPV